MRISLGGWRQGWRSVRQHPWVSGVAIISLALAIGVNTAVFSAWYAVMNHALPVRQPGQLVAIFNLAPTVPGTGYMRVSHLDYLDYAGESDIFSGSYELFQAPAALGTQGRARQITVDLVSGSYFDVLGVRPSLGSVFHPSQTGVDGAGALVVLSQAFFASRFHADPSIVGAQVTLNGTSFRVLGVAAAGFSGTGTLQSPDLWAPVSMHRVLMPSSQEQFFMARNAQFFSVVARLRPGVGVARARAEVRLTGERLARQYAKTDALLTATVEPLLDTGIDLNQRPLFSLAFAVMLAVVGMVLLIACSNVAHLLLARAHARRREMAVRVALGASRAQIVRQLLQESLLLGLSAAALGLLVAAAAQQLMWAHRPALLQSSGVHLSLNLGVLAFTAVTALLATLLFGLAPALTTARAHPAQVLRGLPGGGQRSFRHRLLLAGEAGFSVAILILAGLFLASLRHLQQARPGFDTAHLASLQFDLSATGMSLARPGAAAQLTALELQLLQRVRRQPGVAAATLASGTPMAAMSEQRGYQKFLAAATLNPRMRIANIECISPGSFFATLGIPLLEGRDFLPTDQAGTPRVAIVNQTFARTTWPGQDPIGKRILFHDEDGPTTVVGLAADSTYTSLTEGRVAFAYLPLAQEPSTALGLIVRSQGPPTAVLQPMQRAVLAVNSELAITHLQPAAAALAASLWAPRMGAILLALLSGLATLLAAIGIYGVAAYEVRQCWRDLAIHMALGASQTRIFRSVLVRGLAPVLAGLAAGVAAAVALGRVVASLLFGMGSASPGIAAAYAALFLVVACLALLVPARGATRADPATVLKAWT